MKIGELINEVDINPITKVERIDSFNEALRQIREENKKDERPKAKVTKRKRNDSIKPKKKSNNYIKRRRK